MKIKKIIFILCGIFLLCGCQKSENDITDKEYNNAAKDSCYTVLSNSKELDFATVDNRFWSSQYNDNSEFVIVGYTLVE